MYQLDLWRCSSCQRILGRDLCLGDGSELRARCWGCGAEAVIRLTPEQDSSSTFLAGVALADAQVEVFDGPPSKLSARINRDGAGKLTIPEVKALGAG